MSQCVPAARSALRRCVARIGCKESAYRVIVAENGRDVDVGSRDFRVFRKDRLSAIQRSVP